MDTTRIAADQLEEGDTIVAANPAGFSVRRIIELDEDVRHHEITGRLDDGSLKIWRAGDRIELIDEAPKADPFG